MFGLKKYIKFYIVRPLSEAFNIQRFTRPSLNDIDRKLERILNFDDGTFLEVGANDGYAQSNTYYLECSRNWSGILIEPIPALYKRCKKIRTNSEVFNCICSKPEDSGKRKVIKYANLMSQVRGALNDSSEEIDHIKNGRKRENIFRDIEYKIKCQSLSEIIESSNFVEFDLMSIDVEGHELEVLKGLDLEKYSPRYLLVEAWPHQENEIIEYLSPYYEINDYLSGRDILFRNVSK